MTFPRTYMQSIGGWPANMDPRSDMTYGGYEELEHQRREAKRPKRVCPQCDCIYDRDLIRCPKCGATNE